MSTLSLFSILALAALLALIAVLVRGLDIRSRTSAGPNPAPVDLPDRRSLLEYYRPMLLLLEGGELAAARALPGISYLEWRRFRRDRLRAFRGYLHDIRLDFRRMEFKLRYMMLSASAEEAHMVEELNRVKLQFLWNVRVLEFRLVLFQLGLGSVDASRLIESIRVLEASLQPPPLAAGATA